jgi:hypothetical protein
MKSPRKLDFIAPRLLAPIFFLMLRIVIFVLLIASAARCAAADVEFLHVWPGWRNAESFDRIAEYFGGRETFGRQVVLRTSQDTRAGYYFLVRVKNAAALASAKFELSVIRPDNPEPKIYRFDAAVPARETVFQFGLTGSDWPGGEEANPVAWKVALLGADGRLLAEHKSFLWEKPVK